MPEIKEQISSFLDSAYVISHSDSTVRSYRLAIKHFEEFASSLGFTLAEEVEYLKNNDPYEHLQRFVIYMDKKGLRPRSIKINLTGTRGFLRHCNVKIYTEEFRAKVKIPKAVNVRDTPLTKEIILRILNNVSPKIRTVILVAVSSGMRIGEIIQLKLSDIDFDSKPVLVRIRAETTKTREARETFLTEEAVKALKDYIANYITPEFEESINDKWIFGTTRGKRLQSNPKTIEANLATQMNRQLRKISDLAQIRENGVHMIHFHAFRKYFRTVVGNAVGRDYAEALMGHHFYLDTYYNLADEKKQEMYLKAEPELTISDYSKIEKELKLVTNRQKSIEEKQLDLAKLLEEEYVEFPKMFQKHVRRNES